MMAYFMAVVYKLAKSHAATPRSSLVMSEDYARTGDLTPELEARVKAELQPDERLVWVGQPRPDLFVRAAFFLVPFGLVFGGFALFWIVGSAAMMGGFGANQGFPGFLNFFPLCGVPFLLVGLAMVLSPIWLRRRARQTVYALTSKRAIIWEPGLVGSVTVRNYSAAGLGRMTRTERADGSGDLVFEEFVTTSTNSEGYRTSTTNRRGFLGIDNVRKVEELIRLTLLS
jgi:hypothetical protein